MENTEPKRALSKKGLIILILVLVVAALGAFLWWRNYEKYIVTADANLDSDRVALSSMVMGRIVNQYVEEGDHVKIGQVLIELDSADIVSQRKALLAQQKEIQAQMQVIDANRGIVLKTVALRTSAYKLATDNLNHSKAQLKEKTIPLEEYQTIEEAYQSAKISLDIAQNQIATLNAQTQETFASIDLLNARIESLNNQSSYYRIIATQNGVVAKRWMLPGDIVQTGQTLLTIDMNEKLWLAIYLEETKYSMVSIGQAVKYTLDAYPGLTFWGKVYYIGSNTASQFSLIPASNASGNFTKVTQRIPIKISIDSITGNTILKEQVKLASGMSAEVKIIK